MNRVKINNSFELEELQLEQEIIKNLSKKLQLPNVRSGRVVIRDEKGYRVNEKEIDYCWLINVTKSFIGWCWLFSIKFTKSSFRETENPDELIQGIFTIEKDGGIQNFFRTSISYTDKVKEYTTYDFFNANKGITLDGIGYKYIIFARNTKVYISLNNPSSDSWMKWKEEVDKLGTELSRQSKFYELLEIFK